MKHTAVLQACFAEHNVTLNLAGAHCRLRTNSLAVVESLAAFAAPEPQGPELLLDVYATQAADVREPAHFRGMGPFVIAEYGANVFLFDVARRKVHAWITEAAARDREFWAEQWLPVIVGVAGIAAGVLPLHSACVVKNGRGVLIAGESMAGKSTFSVAMAKQGFELLSDDWTYIHRGINALFARGFHLPVKLLPDAAAFFPELHELRPAPTLNGEIAYTATAGRLGVECTAHCKIVAMLFLQRSTAGWPTFTIAEPEFARAYVENSVERLPPELHELQRERTRLIDGICQLPSWHYQYCGVPSEGAASAASFLNSIGGLL
ncbi:MAG TPA: hypothetical protein VGL89_19385 [Candidatus Koribacter sp.]|jgi:hypothetical protein